MIPARHTRFHTWFFRFYTGWRIRRNFSSVTIHNDLRVLPDLSLLVIANHFSWWDGFFILWLNSRLFKRKFHVMMLEDQLRKNKILNKTGAFSIRKGGRDAVDSLNYGANLLGMGADERGGRTKDGQSLVLMFPQGEIRSMHERPVKFERGIERMTRGLENKLCILMVVVLVDYFSAEKPELHFYLKEYQFKKELIISELEAAFNIFLDESVERQKSLAH